MKSIRWQTLKDLPGLLAPPETDPAQQAMRIQSLERDIMLPVKAVLLLVIGYFLFVAMPVEDLEGRRLRSLEVVGRWLVTLQTVQALFWVYAGLNVLTAAMLLGMLYLPLKLVQWVVFTMGILDGLFLAALTLVSGGFDSLLYWVFLGLIIRNAFSIPLAMQQLVMNLSVSGCYLLAGLMDVAISEIPSSVLDRARFWFDEGQLETTAEPFLLRLALLLLMTICCYGLQVLIEKQIRAVEEAGEFAMRQEQLRAAGRVAAEIAHQIKNPLGIINTAAYSLQRSLKDANASVTQQLQMIREEVERSDRIVTELMGYAKLAEGKVEKLKVVEELERALASVLPAIGPFETQVERHFSPNLPALLMQRTHLNEIFVNLLLNAREAMQGKGRITLTAKAGEKHSIVVVVADTGPGIPPDRRERIFEAYYSTRESGTGLGLTIVKHNAELYGGTVRVESELGKGARFILHFPARTLMTMTGSA